VNVTVYLAIGGAAVVLLGVMVWLHARQQAAMDRLDDRIAHLMAGVSLLTDTTEGGLRDFAMEIGRMSAAKAPAQRSRPTTQRRVARAVKLGQSLTDIAATEGVSEGEVRLHLQMEKTRKERAHHAALR
jgi:DNA-binding NarL/FixJ family response regulator